MEGRVEVGGSRADPRRVADLGPAEAREEARVEVGGGVEVGGRSSRPAVQNVMVCAPRYCRGQEEFVAMEDCYPFKIKGRSDTKGRLKSQLKKKKKNC